MNKTKKTVIKGATIVMFGFGLSRILGYIKLKSLAYVFGSTWQTDAYVAVFNVIDMLYFLIAGGALSAAFIPVFMEYLSKKDERESWEIANNILNILLTVSALGIFIWMIFTPYFVKLIVPGFDEKTTSLCVLLTRITLPMVFFTVISALFSGILNSFGNFFTPTFAFVFYNIPTILVILLLGPKFGIVILPLGVLLGAMGLVIIQLPPLIKSGWRYKTILNISHPKVKQIIKLFIPAMLALLVFHFNLVIIPQFFASFFKDGVVTYLLYASRIIMLPYGVFAVAISVAIFPTLTAKSHESNLSDWRNILSKGISSTFYFSLPSSVFLIILSEKVVKLLYWGGEFNNYDVSQTSFLLIYFTVGLVALSAIQVIIRGFHSQKDTITPLKVGVLCLVLNIALAYFLSRSRLGYAGPPLAVSLTLIFNMTILLVILKVNYRIIVGGFLKSLLSSIILAIVIFAGMRIINNFITTTTLGGIAIELAILIGIGSLSYLLVTYLLKMEEIYTMVEVLRKKLF